MFASAVALNNGNGTFTLKPLPAEAQFAPIYASVAGDFDGGGKVDLVVGGNLWDVTPELGRYDASYGLMLRGDGQGDFTAIEMQQSGLSIDGQVRDMKLVRDARGPVIAVARNNDRLMMIRVVGNAGSAVTKQSPKTRSARPGN